MLYTLLTDSNNFLEPLLDRAQIDRLVGQTSNNTIDDRIELNNAPRSFKDIITEPLNVSFPEGTKEQKGCTIPEIAVFQGRLFLSMRAYNILKTQIEDDGEFLPLNYENGEGFMFTPLRVAEEVDAIDTKLSRKNEWGDLEHLAFNESKVKDWLLFRTKFENYFGLHCQEAVKNAIKTKQLKGLYITPDLGRIFPCEGNEYNQVN